MSEHHASGDSMTIAPHIYCRSCASPLVQASDWEQDKHSCWHVRLWCPECGFERYVVLDKAQASYLSSAIEHGFALVLESLEELQRFHIRAGNDTFA